MDSRSFFGPGEFMRTGDAPRTVQWIESVARAGIARWTGLPGKEMSVTGSGIKAPVNEIW